MVNLKDIETKYLSEELETRIGISTFEVDPHEEIKIITGHGEQIIQGPAIILINQD